MIVTAMSIYLGRYSAQSRAPYIRANLASCISEHWNTFTVSRICMVRLHRTLWIWALQNLPVFWHLRCVLYQAWWVVWWCRKI